MLNGANYKHFDMSISHKSARFSSDNFPTAMLKVHLTLDTFEEGENCLLCLRVEFEDKT